MAPTPQTIAITGATGLIGTALRQDLGRRGHQVYRVTRSPDDPDTDIEWHPREADIDAARLEGVDTVIHLAGENLFGRWSDAKKEAILTSRSQGTRLLAETIAALARPPELFISASAVGYYGDTDQRKVDESAPVGDSFLAEVCTQWEAACQPAKDAGIRTVNPRLGVVLSTDGGALKMMLTPFKLGVGGRIGDGDQFLSWISLTDVVRGIRFIMDHPDLDGPVNLSAPNPVANQQFTKTLGKVLHRPTFMALPSALVKVGAGQMGREMLLEGQRAIPDRLDRHGFDFRYPDLAGALRHEIAGA